MMNSITRSLNIVAILTKNRDRKQFFLSVRLYVRKWLLASVSQMYSFLDKKFVFDLFFYVKVATMFKLLVILFIINNNN